MLDIAGGLLRWEELDSWITPNDKFFTIKHFGQPTIDLQMWRLDVAGLVQQPLTLTLDDLKAPPRRESPSPSSAPATTAFPGTVV